MTTETAAPASHVVLLLPPAMVAQILEDASPATANAVRAQIPPGTGLPAPSPSGAERLSPAICALAVLIAEQAAGNQAQRYGRLAGLITAHLLLTRPLRSAEAWDWAALDMHAATRWAISLPALATAAGVDR